MPTTYRGHTTFNVRFLKPWFANHEVVSDENKDQSSPEGCEEDPELQSDSVDETHDVSDDVTTAASPEPPARRSQRGLKPSRRLVEAVTEGERGGVKHTLLQALMGKTVNTKVDPIVRNIPIPTNLGTLQIPDVTHTGI